MTNGRRYMMIRDGSKSFSTQDSLLPLWDESTSCLKLSLCTSVLQESVQNPECGTKGLRPWASPDPCFPHRPQLFSFFSLKSTPQPGWLPVPSALALCVSSLYLCHSLSISLSISHPLSRSVFVFCLSHCSLRTLFNSLPLTWISQVSAQVSLWKPHRRGGALVCAPTGPCVYLPHHSVPHTLLKQPLPKNVCSSLDC